jgi:diguanylate cyclase (GGDEF)-like protein
VETPETTLLVVLQVVGLILTLLLVIGARQARHRIGAWLWVAGFAMHPASQALRQVATASFGHYAGLPFGHVGGVAVYALIYVGTLHWLGRRPHNAFAVVALALALLFSVSACMHEAGYVSLALTICVSALFQSLVALAFWQSFRRDGGLVRALAAAVFALSALTALGRAYSVVPDWHAPGAVLPANTHWLLVFIALMILQAGSLLNLINQALLDQLRSLADFDALTGLLNRGGLARRLRHRRAHADGTAPAVALLCMDLDHFKAINDNHGHGAGDDVLRGLGRLLQDNARPGDLVSRSGGEEFGLVVDTDSESALLVFGERLRAIVQDTCFATRAGPLQLTISVGAAFARGGEESLESVWERADHALMEAKRSGRNRVMLGVRA